MILRLITEIICLTYTGKFIKIVTIVWFCRFHSSYTKSLLKWDNVHKKINFKQHFTYVIN